MLPASAFRLRRPSAQIEHYQRVFAQLEQAFSAYEAGQTSIIAYAETVRELAQSFEQQRPAWLRLCDWLVVLRWLNRAEREAFRDMVAALDWCLAWAVRQRRAQVTDCLQRADAEVVALDPTECGSAETAPTQSLCTEAAEQGVDGEQWSMAA